MVNLKPQILKLLKTIEEAKQVSFFYPEEWSDDKLPAISYYEAQNSTDIKTMDGVEHTSNIVFIFDIWAKNPGKNSTIAVELNKKLQEIGFTREMSIDLYETATKLHHKSMRYRAIVDEFEQIL